MAEILEFRPFAASTSMRVRALVEALSRHLSASDVPEAAREARDIVAATIDMPRFWPSLNSEEILTGDLCARAWDAAKRRAKGTPFAYAVGRAAFRHLTLDVDERVLIPRQETEILVDCILERRQHGVAIDIGTGSGAIALALATEGHFQRLIATDVSREALEVAKANVARLSPALHASVELRHGSFFAPVRGERADVLVANPPYIALDEASTLPASVRDWEPPLALFSAQNGMASIASIIREGPDVLTTDGLLALEVDARRASLAVEMAMSDGRYRDVSVERDMAGRERVLLARRTPTEDRGLRKRRC